MKLLIVLIIAFCGCNASYAIEPSDCLIIPHARVKTEKQAVKTSPAAFMRTANSGHQFTTGESTVVALRIFDDDHAGVDSQVFTKITLELVPEAAKADKSDERRVLHSFYTSGGVGFIQRGEYWVAYDFTPAIKLTYDGAQQFVAIDAQFKSAKASDDTRKDVTVRFSCRLRQVAVENLNEWQGKPSIKWKAFAPPTTQ